MAIERENLETDARPHIQKLDDALQRHSSPAESQTHRDNPPPAIDRDPANPRSISGSAAETYESYDEELASAEEVDSGNRQAEDELRRAGREAQGEDDME